MMAFKISASLGSVRGFATLGARGAGTSGPTLPNAGA